MRKKRSAETKSVKLVSCSLLLFIRVKLTGAFVTEFANAKDPSIYLVAPDAMQESDYIMPDYEELLPFGAPVPTGPTKLKAWKQPAGHIRTPQKRLSDEVKVYAVDCEMVRPLR